MKNTVESQKAAAPGSGRSAKRGPYRQYTAQFKDDLGRRCRQPGASVTRIAIEEGINPNLVRKWLQLGHGRDSAPPKREQTLVPVRVVQALEPSLPTANDPLPVDAGIAQEPCGKKQLGGATVLELCIGTAVLRMHDPSDAQLRTVLATMAVLR